MREQRLAFPKGEVLLVPLRKTGGGETTETKARGVLLKHLLTHAGQSGLNEGCGEEALPCSAQRITGFQELEQEARI